jgi:adenosylcobinamide-GDP ribazoletransferase
MWSDIRAAFAFLTILPVGYPADRKPGYSFAYFPLVGLLIGLALAGVALIPLPLDLHAFAVLLFWIGLTGGLHLDGFGDSCDGLLATTTPERRLEIMKDPRTGTWAVVGLILLLMCKWLLLKSLLSISPQWIGLILLPVVGRLALVIAAAGFPYARSSGLGGYFRDGLGRPQVIIALSTTLLLTVASTLVLGWRGIALFGLPFLVVIVIGHWAAKRLGGGLTGDVYGALCELTELFGLLLLVL